MFDPGYTNFWEDLRYIVSRAIGPYNLGNATCWYSEDLGGSRIFGIRFDRELFRIRKFEYRLQLGETVDFPYNMIVDLTRQIAEYFESIQLPVDDHIVLAEN